MPEKKSKIIIKFILLIFIIIILFILGVLIYKKFGFLFLSAEKFKEFILGFGIYSSLIFILLSVAQVLFAPIPGQVTGIVSGYIFGVFRGTLYSMIGVTIGSFIVFVLARKLGRPFVEKMANKKMLEKFDKTIAEKGWFALFLIYLLPFFPDDVICYLAGLTKIKIKNLVLISIIGRLPGFLILSLVGSGFSTASKFSFWIFIVVILLSFLVYIFKDKLEKFMHNLFGK